MYIVQQSIEELLAACFPHVVLYWKFLLSRVRWPACGYSIVVFTLWRCNVNTSSAFFLSHSCQFAVHARFIQCAGRGIIEWDSVFGIEWGRGTIEGRHLGQLHNFRHHSNRYLMTRCNRNFLTGLILLTFWAYWLKCVCVWMVLWPVGQALAALYVCQPSLSESCCHDNSGLAWVLHLQDLVCMKNMPVSSSWSLGM